MVKKHETHTRCSDGCPETFPVMEFFSRKLAIFNMILILLFQVLFTMDASDKIVLTPNDPRGVVGESLQMWCTISSTSMLKSLDLELHVQLETGHLIQVDPRFIHGVNETTVEMNYLDLPSGFNNALVICRQNASRSSQTRTTEIDTQLLRVGYRPFKPFIVKDYKVYNWEYFLFTWVFNETDPVHLTRYDAWFRTTTEVEFTRCPGGQKDGKSVSAEPRRNTCKIQKALDLVHPNGFLWFKVNGSNAVGQITSDIERTDLYHIIQPGKVKNVTVKSTVSNGVLAEFYSPSYERRLKYRISVSCGNITWPFVMIKNLSYPVSKGPIHWKIEHDFPPFTKCHLSVSCLPFHNRQYWSDWSEIVSFTSPDGFPLVGPELCCFEAKSINSRIREIKIYYKNLIERQAQGEVVRYHIHFNTSGSQVILPDAGKIYAEPDKTFFSLDIYTETGYTVSIAAETRAGRNTSAVSLMSVLSKDEALSLPENMTAIWYGSRTVIVSWLLLEPRLFNYTVVWCKGSSGCEKPVDWEIVSCKSYHTIQLPPHETHLSYRFGIVVSSVGGRSSGIKWFECTYNISAGASAPRVNILNKTSSAVSLYFFEPVCAGGNNGYIYEYQIHYIKDKKVFFTRNPCQLKSTEWIVVIDGLEPESNYCFRVVALTSIGPSEEAVINVTTDPSGKLKPHQLVLISVGAVFGSIFILFGIYFCYRWNEKQYFKIKKWLHLDIAVPRKQTLDSRGVADGINNRCLSASYTSLTRNQKPLHGSRTLHSEQNSSDVEAEKGDVLEVTIEAAHVVQETRPLTEGGSAPLPPTVKNLSGPDERFMVASEDGNSSIVSNAKLGQSRVVLVSRSSGSARPRTSSASREESVSDQLMYRRSADKKSISEDTNSIVLQNLEPNLSQPKHFSSRTNYEVSSSSVSGSQAVRSSSIPLTYTHRVGSITDHSLGDATGCVTDDTTCSGTDHAAGIVEESNPTSRTSLALATETRNEPMDGAASSSQNCMKNLNAGNFGNVAILSLNPDLDGCDEVEDYSNVRLADPSEHMESSAVTYADGYSLARPAAAGDEMAEDESDNDYSSAMLLDSIAYQLDATTAQPIVHSVMESSSHYEDAEEDEEEQNSANYSSAFIRTV